MTIRWYWSHNAVGNSNHYLKDTLRRALMADKLVWSDLRFYHE